MGMLVQVVVVVMKGCRVVVIKGWWCFSACGDEGVVVLVSRRAADAVPCFCRRASGEAVVRRCYALFAAR